MFTNTIYEAFFPAGFVSQFSLVDIQELGEVQHKRTCFYIYLEEKNIVPPEYNFSDFEPRKL